MNNSDFSFIDSDGSSKSEMVDPLNSLGRTSQESNQDSMLTIPEEMFTLKDTYIPETNSSFEITPNKLPNISAFCQDNECHECLCDCQIEAFNGNFTVISKDTVALASQNQSPYAECQQGIVDDDLKKTQTVIDDNGNLQAKVVSARLRPKGVTRTDSCRSPVNQSRSGDGEFEQFLSLVKNISHEGPLSYQPSKSALSTIRVLDEQIKEDKQTSPDESPLTENHVMGEVSEISFKDFHAKVAPVSRTPAKSTMLSGGEQSHSITSALSLTSDHQAKLCPPSICAPSSDTSSTGPPHEGPTYTSCTTSNTDQPLVDAHHSLLPEETQPASNLPYQESRPHPVKPLTSSQSEKKEGRTVLEKLKSTISPGRAAQQATAEPEKSLEVMVDVSQYQDLTNMELISLLLQQEMDMQKQRVASERQEAQLEKCETELKKVKSQVRDLEDYIDNLLLRIMEQTPTLLQVRTRHK